MKRGNFTQARKTVIIDLFLIVIGFAVFSFLGGHITSAIRGITEDMDIMKECVMCIAYGASMGTIYLLAVWWLMSRKKLIPVVATMLAICIFATIGVIVYKGYLLIFVLSSLVVIWVARLNSIDWQDERERERAREREQER